MSNVSGSKDENGVSTTKRERAVIIATRHSSQCFPRHKAARFSTEVGTSPYCANTISLVSNSARKNLNVALWRNVSVAGLQMGTTPD